MSKRTVIRKNIHSEHLNQTRSLRIFLPPDYNVFREYPVIYCQDGEDFFNFGKIATFAYEGILEEGFDPMIIVGVDVDKRTRTDQYAPHGSLQHAYIQFFVHELVPFIEQSYTVKADKIHRIIAGDSLGGTVSLHIALAYPEVFGKIMSLSGAFFQDTYTAIQQRTDLSDLHGYFLVGTGETEVNTSLGVVNFVKGNREAKALLEARGAQLEYREAPGEHTWGFWQKHVLDALRHFCMV